MSDTAVFMRLGDEDILAEVQIVPVIPAELTPIDFCEIRDELLTRGPMKEIVLSMWQDRAPAETIMRLMCLSEAELDEILPKKLWLGVHHTSCHRCKGLGFISTIVPWEKRS